MPSQSKTLKAALTALIANASGQDVQTLADAWEAYEVAYPRSSKALGESYLGVTIKAAFYGYADPSN